MKHITTFFSLFCVFIVTFTVVRAQSQPDGADLLIEAVRSRAENHTLVHSLSYVTEQTYWSPTLSEEEIEKKVSESMEDLRESFRRIKQKDPNALILPVDEEDEQVIREQMQGSVISRFAVKYKAPSVSRKLLSLQIERQRPDAEGRVKWYMDTNVIEANIVSNKSESEGVVWFPQERSAQVNDSQSYTETLLNFGRLQGPPVFPMSVLLFQDADLEKYEFSEKNIIKFKAERDKQLRSGKTKGLITQGTVTYDGDATAYIVESSTDGKVVERYWIDVNRGYVCPLLQYYDAKGTLLSEYKSENYFLHEKSGLWFPQLYKEMTTDKDGKQVIKEYRIDQSSLDVNFPLADEEFLVEITAGANVTDNRKGKGSKKYKAIENGVLSLGKDGLDLEKMDWLWVPGAASLVSSSMSLWRIVFLALSFTLGLLMILLGFYYRFRRKT